LTDITPEFIMKLYASSADFGSDGAAELMQFLAGWFTRAEEYARDTGGSLNSVRVDFIMKGANGGSGT
jgi:hypothetical protein